jgi:deoxyribodipyrimidine photolyase-like uncharacterized protein
MQSNLNEVQSMVFEKDNEDEIFLLTKYFELNGVMQHSVEKIVAVVQVIQQFKNQLLSSDISIEENNKKLDMILGDLNELLALMNYSLR